MRKIIYSPMVSLDGFVETSDHKLDWVIIDEELHTYINDRQRDIDLDLNGRRMYELMADFWPTADADPANPAYIIDYSRIWKKMPKIVFSKTLERVEWNAVLSRQIDPAEIARLKQQPGKDIGIGGAELAAEFMRLGLVDEFWLYLQPVLLGRGTPMFPPLAAPLKLRLVETHTFHSGVILLRYARSES